MEAVIHACIEPLRPHKTYLLMKAFTVGWPGSRLHYGLPPEGMDPFVVWGQQWTAAEAIRRAEKEGRPYFDIDNGFWEPGRGNDRGYYKITYRGLSPVFLPDAPDVHGLPTLKPWRKTGSHILLAYPGTGFGAALGMDMESWIAGAEAHIREFTDRKIIVRPKTLTEPLGGDLRDCWALVTHSSNVAVDAVIAGIPVFVAPTNPASPVGNHYLTNIEDPVMPERTQWLRSLASQHFKVWEMREGHHFEKLKRVIEIGDLDYARRRLQKDSGDAARDDCAADPIA